MLIEFDEYRLQLNSMKSDLSDLRSAIAYEHCKEEIPRLEKLTEAEDFWNDAAQSKKILREVKQYKDKVESFDSLYSKWEDLNALVELAAETDDDSLLPEFEEEFKVFSTELEKEKLAALLCGEYDGNNAILSFHAGAGGTEAQDWAEMLYRMYTHWAEQHGFSYKLVNYLDGDQAGMKSADIVIEGPNAYGYLKSEAGVHRLVRISPFDASGRRHTSFAALEVLPEIDDNTEIEIRPEDLKIDTYRSSGAGGQHVNKTESAVRITHIPSGIVVACQNERSQFQNKDVAMRMLKSKLLEIKESEHYDQIADIKGVQKKIEWGSQIRSYVFMPYTLVKDHRTGFENGNINAVMNGDIDGFINAYLKADANGTLKK